MHVTANASKSLHFLPRGGASLYKTLLYSPHLPELVWPPSLYTIDMHWNLVSVRKKWFIDGLYSQYYGGTRQIKCRICDLLRRD